MKAALGISATAIKLGPEGFPKLLSCRRGENLYGLPVSIATIGAISKTAGNQDPEKPPNPTHPGAVGLGLEGNDHGDQALSMGVLMAPPLHQLCSTNKHSQKFSH